MRIRRNGGNISIRDRVGPFWALGLFLLAGGLVAVAMPLGLATNAGDLEPWESVASELWSHDRAGVEESVSVVAEACRLPRTRPSGAMGG